MQKARYWTITQLWDRKKTGIPINSVAFHQIFVHHLLMCSPRTGAAVMQAPTVVETSLQNSIKLQQSCYWKYQAYVQYPPYLSIVREMSDILSCPVLPVALQHYWLPLRMDREIYKEIIGFYPFLPIIYDKERWGTRYRIVFSVEILWFWDHKKIDLNSININKPINYLEHNIHVGGGKYCWGMGRNQHTNLVSCGTRLV